MRVCDMCLKDLADITECFVKFSKNSILAIDEDYVLCSKCSRKLERYINFEQNKKQAKGRC